MSWGTSWSSGCVRTQGFRRRTVTSVISVGQWVLLDHNPKSFVQMLLLFDNYKLQNFIRHYFLYSTLYCYAIVYKYSRGKSRGTLLKYTRPSSVTVRVLGNLISPRTLSAHFAFRLPNPISFRRSLDVEMFGNNGKTHSTKLFEITKLLSRYTGTRFKK